MILLNNLKVINAQYSHQYLDKEMISDFGKIKVFMIQYNLHGATHYVTNDNEIIWSVNSDRIKIVNLFNKPNYFNFIEKNWKYNCTAVGQEQIVQKIIEFYQLH